MLRLQGHDVRTAQNPNTALCDAPSLAPDAIIVDLHMPLMDGLTFVQRLRAQERGGVRTPVAMVTGDYGLTPTLTHALEDLGVTVCLKPLWLEDIAQLTSQLLAIPAH
jgi:CheY-like chemotaxis protein